MLAQTQKIQAGITPRQALEMLKEGNRRFVEGRMETRDLTAQVAQTGDGQYPFAIVLGCVDSRVPPEIVFDQGLGDIFSARIAGNFVNEDILGSMEFATRVAGAKLIVVLGHTQCGAVMGAIDGVKLGNLTALLSNLTPVVEAVAGPGERSSTDGALVQAVAERNVEATIENIRERSPLLREMWENCEIDIVGGMYDVATGRVTFTR